VSRNIRCLLIGVYFGIVLLKSEVASWYRIQQMFHFGSLRMYGILALAVGIGALSVWLMQSFHVRALGGETLDLKPKPEQEAAQLFGGIVFGCGWALTGACPGPLYALVGAGYLPMIVVLLSALAGTYVYGIVREKLPH
jgi:uncharacterized protein